MTAGVFTDKRDKRRLDSEKQRNEQESIERARDLLFESKRQAFSAALRHAEELRSLTREVYRNLSVLTTGLLPIDLQERFTDWEEIWVRMRSEVALLDETIFPSMKIVQEAMHDLFVELQAEEPMTNAQMTIEDAINDLRTHMQDSLVGR